jgi:putative DNA primase/helicase
MKTIEAAAGKWPGILKHFGLADEYLQNRHGACPLCGGKDRYRFDDKDGTGSYFCSGCGAGYGMDLLTKYTNKDFKDAANEVDQIVGNIHAEAIRNQKNTERTKNLCKYLIAAKDSPQVMAYLKSRKLPCSSGLMALKSTSYYEDAKHIAD